MKKHIEVTIDAGKPFLKERDVRCIPAGDHYFVQVVIPSIEGEPGMERDISFSGEMSHKGDYEGVTCTRGKDVSSVLFKIPGTHLLLPINNDDYWLEAILYNKEALINVHRDPSLPIEVKK